MNGPCLEARLDKGQGAVVTGLLRRGALAVGEHVVAGTHFGQGWSPRHATHCTHSCVFALSLNAAALNRGNTRGGVYGLYTRWCVRSDVGGERLEPDE